MLRFDQILRIFLVLAVFVLNPNTSEAALPSTDTIRIYFEGINTEKIQVTYALDQPVHSLQLLSTPNQSRADFWKAKSDDFELAHLSGNDVIRRTDGKLFETVAFVVDIVDISLPNYYRPFSPLFESNNGLVAHTGQYFVCRNICGDTTTTWQIEIEAVNKNIIHYQGASISKASWQDSGDGRPFYVGSMSPIESEYLVAIIDPGLPAKLKTILDAELPSLIDRLGEKFEALKTKPLVFATYHRGDPERRGFQGGVLNKTVFMHWWGTNLEQRINENDTLWFIAHEIAHFYQSQQSAVDVDEVAWIHEGFAELMAANLLAQTNDDLKSYVQHRYRAAKESCATGLEITPIGKATQLKQFDLHYKCGLLLHRFISQNTNGILSVFELWNRYRAAIDRGMPPSKQTYLDVVKQFLQKDDFLVLQTIVGSETAPSEVIKRFLEGSTFSTKSE